MQQQFSELLIRPQQISGKQGRDFLKKMTEIFPYCQPARMLFAKALMESKSAFFEQQLNIATACAPDRRLFRAYLAENPHTSQASVANGVTACADHTVDAEKKEAKNDSSDSDNSKKARQQNIIDRFLEEDPRIQPGAESKVSEGDLAAGSIEDKGDLASETLAEILLKQGKKEQAIVIYHKLSLMFPEKSSYFAKKLEHIQSENN